MIDANFVKKTDFLDIVYIILGMGMLSSPWLLLEEFFETLIEMSWLNVMVLILCFYISCFTGLLFILGPHKKNIKFAFVKTIYIFLIVFIVNSILLMILGKVSLDYLSIDFAKIVISTMFWSSTGGLFADLLLKGR